MNLTGTEIDNNTSLVYLFKSLDWAHWLEFILIDLVVTTLIIAGIIGNVFNVIVFRDVEFKTINIRIIFIALAISDIIGMVCLSPYQVWRFNHSMFFQDSLSYGFQIYYFGVMADGPRAMAQCASQWYAVVMAVTRAVSVWFPHSRGTKRLYTKTANYSIAIAVAVFSILAYGDLVWPGFVTTKQGNNWRLVPVANYWRTNIKTPITTFVPNAISVVGTLFLVIGLRVRRSAVRDKKTETKMMNRQEQKMTKCLIAVNVVNVLCNIPYFVLRIGWVNTVALWFSGHGPFGLWSIFVTYLTHIGIGLNASINIIVYWRINSTYARVFKQRILCRGSLAVGTNQSNSQSANVDTTIQR